jgi:hypothetical protein
MSTRPSGVNASPVGVATDATSASLKFAGSVAPAMRVASGPRSATAAIRPSPTMSERFETW